MKGKIKVSVKNRHINFTFTLERNITVLTGESGTGKTKLINMVREHYNLGKSSGVTLKCDRPCIVLEGRRWENELANTNGSIVFVEESTLFLNSKAFASAIQKTDNYYVLVTREPLAQIPYSIDEIYFIHKNGKNPKFEKIYRDISVNRISDFPYDLVIVEDSKAGYQFFSKATENSDLECLTSGGKSGIVKLLEEHSGKKVLVIADAAAFGSEIKKIQYLKNKSENKIDLFLPESFEWLILKSAVFGSSNEVKEVLASPADYIESEDYFSWERFFTDFLVKASKGKHNLEYHKDKSKLPAGYLAEGNMNNILKAME